MRAAQIILTLALLAMAHHARSACTPFRLGFVNQHRPPYFLGNGSTEARPPGASVDLIRDISAAAGCAIMAVRLPPLRLRNALVSRDIDATLMNVAETDAGEFALPLDKNGKLDPARAVTMYTVVFVRAADNIPLDADPRAYFMSHRLGTNNGASLVRLKTPLRIHHFWLGFTKSYYARNRDAVETMWAWMGEHADLRFAWHVEQYAKVPLQPPGEKSK
jgi:hypothetical protein